MRQLVELGEQAEKFEEMGTKVIAVFREEAEAEEGLKKIKEKTETPFVLALDRGNEKTGRYSSERGEFSGYVIDPSGKITSIFEGNLRDRAKSKEVLEAVAAAAGEEGSGERASESRGSSSKGSSSKGSSSKGSGKK